ncbi:MAG: peptidyl-prolyl cis-trans isomerase [Nitrospirae bacterium]|nr:peptidyl-prolyl cis-trans isomerase [Nitrospirota bacterium]
MELKNKYLHQYAGFVSHLLMVCFLLSAGLLFGCVSMGKKTDALAYVDGDPITREDLSYSLGVEHRREDLSTAKALDMKDYLNKLINERLIIQEARRMGMQEYPEAKEKIQAFIVRESVLMLHEDEILKKVSSNNEDEIKKYYKENYKIFKLDVLGFNSKDDASRFRDLILQGSDVSRVSKEEAGINRIDEGKEFSYRSLAQSMQKAVSGLNPGEYSDVVEVKGVYYILKLLGVTGAPDDKLESVRAHIEKSLGSIKEEERSNQYLEELREQSTLKIDNDILLSLKLGVEDGDRAKLANDNRTLVTVNGEVLTVGEFIALLPPVIKITNEQLLNSWITRKLVDQEALRRRYDLQPKLEGMVRRYENQVLQNLYINEVILPNIQVSDDILNAYYDKHQQDYLTPSRYKIQVIAVEKMDEAVEIYNSLIKGADFSWFARMRSKDVSAEKGGNMGWRNLGELPLPLKEIIDTLKPGDISPVLQAGSRYSIYNILEIEAPKAKALSEVKPDVYRAYMAEEFSRIHDTNMEQLKADTEIIINDDAIKAFEKGFK